MTGQQARASLPPILRMINDLRSSGSDTEASVKSCCATVYGIDLVALFLGESYHPGGTQLTRRLADRLGLQPGERVLDVACGIGTTALLLAAERDVDVVGVELGAAQIAKARARASEAGLSHRSRFELGDAEQLPVDDGQFDAVVCECALCTFPDKATAAAEMVRALRPGGRVGITDIWLDPAKLDLELRGLAGRIACVADARPIADTVAVLDRAGLTIREVEHHDDALRDTIDRIVVRLRALRLVDLPALRGFDFALGIDVAGRLGELVDRGHAGYALITAVRG